MDINDQRDCAEEDYNRAAMEREGIEEALTEAKELIGPDLFFLISKKGQTPYTTTISDIAESLEFDLFYPDEEPRVVNAMIYLTEPGEPPAKVDLILKEVTRNSAWITKIAQIYYGRDLIAQALYQAPTLGALNG